MMAKGGVVNVAGADPQFIDYLINKATHETYFLVGKDKTKIGAVKLMLAAHSDVLRSELLDSPLAEKGNIYLEDISPRTFKNLLRYVYGYNTISNLLFDEADDLLYAADKYLIKDLKAQLASRVMGLLDYTNICRLLNNPACHTVLELDAKITEILQYETDAVFESPDFINLRIEGFIKILEQDALAVSEIKVWRAALKWVKNHDVSSTAEASSGDYRGVHRGCRREDHAWPSTAPPTSPSTDTDCSSIVGPMPHTRRFSSRKTSLISPSSWKHHPQRNALQEGGKPSQSAVSATLSMEGCSEDGSILRKYISELKHIRIRTFKLEDFCKEIVPTNILSDNEVVQICTSHGKGEPIPCIMGFSDKTDLRQMDKNEFKINVSSTSSLSQSSFTITPTSDIILLPLEFQANCAQSSTTDYQCVCTIEIKPTSINLITKVTFLFNEKVDCGQIFKVPLPSKYRRLSSNKSYTITITFNLPHKVYRSDQICTCENFKLESHMWSRYYYHFSSLKFLKLPSK